MAGLAVGTSGELYWVFEDDVWVPIEIMDDDEWLEATGAR